MGAQHQLKYVHCHPNFSRDMGDVYFFVSLRNWEFVLLLPLLPKLHFNLLHVFIYNIMINGLFSVIQSKQSIKMTDKNVCYLSWKLGYLATPPPYPSSRAENPFESFSGKKKTKPHFFWARNIRPDPRTLKWGHFPTYLAACRRL